MRKLITARARKNKRTARMLGNIRKDHSIPLHEVNPCLWQLSLVASLDWHKGRILPSVHQTHQFKLTLFLNKNILIQNI